VLPVGAGGELEVTREGVTVGRNAIDHLVDRHHGDHHLDETIAEMTAEMARAKVAKAETKVKVTPEG
jgi:hypothetical protein